MNSNRKQIAITTLASVALIVCSSAPALATSPEQEVGYGLYFYNHHNYRSAAEHLERAVKAKPGLDVARYCYANALSLLKLPVQALAEYRACHQITHSDTLKQYCSTAIEAYANLPRQQESTKAQDAAQSDPTRSPQESSISATLAFMNQQAGVVKDINREQCAALARDELKFGEYRIVDLQREADDVTTMMRSEWRVSRITGQMMPVYSQEEVEEVAERYKKQILTVRTRAKEEAEKKQQAARDYSKRMDIELISLKNQLYSALGVPGTPHLQPVGTNLYVRMYAAPTFKPNTTPPEELLATQDKLIIERGVKPSQKRYRVVPAESEAVQDRLIVDQSKSGSNKANLKVSGRLLHMH